MRKITISVDEETLRRAWLREAEMNTSILAPVRHYLQTPAFEQAEGAPTETAAEPRGRLLSEVLADVMHAAWDWNRGITFPGRSYTTGRGPGRMQERRHGIGKCISRSSSRAFCRYQRLRLHGKPATLEPERLRRARDLQLAPDRWASLTLRSAIRRIE